MVWKLSTPQRDLLKLRPDHPANRMKEALAYSSAFTELIYANVFPLQPA